MALPETPVVPKGAGWSEWRGKSRSEPRRACWSPGASGKRAPPSLPGASPGLLPEGKTPPRRLMMGGLSSCCPPAEQMCQKPREMDPGLCEEEDGAGRKPRPPGQLQNRRGPFCQPLGGGIGPQPLRCRPSLPTSSFRAPEETQTLAPALPRTTGLPLEKLPFSGPRPPETRELTGQ